METPFPNKIVEEKINTETQKKDKIDFNIFNSSLFLSDFQENEENSSENNKNGKKFPISNESKDNNEILNEIPKFNCLTTELINIIDNDSNNNIEENKKDNEKENKIQDFKKINKNLLSQCDIPTNEKNKILNSQKENIFYEENINGLEYQLKFIENSLNKVLPRSYHQCKYSNKLLYFTKILFFFKKIL